MISVIMPVYGRKNMIETALMSYCSQTADSELVIVDDASPEDMYLVIEKHMQKDKRIRYLRNEKNRGQAFSNNRAMENAKGDIICQLHTDDILPNGVLSKRIEWHEKTGAEVIYTNWGKFFIDGEAYYEEKPEIPAPINIIKKEHINFLTLSWKKSVLEKVGNFDTDYRAYFDWDWKIRLSMECSVAYVPEISIFYRVHSDQLSVACRNDGTNEKEYLLMREKMKARYGGLF